MDEKGCPRCGQRNPPGSEFCNKCGHSLAESTAKPQRKWGVLAAVIVGLGMCALVGVVALVLLVRGGVLAGRGQGTAVAVATATLSADRPTPIILALKKKGNRPADLEQPLGPRGRPLRTSAPTHGPAPSATKPPEQSPTKTPQPPPTKPPERSPTKTPQPPPTKPPERSPTKTPQPPPTATPKPAPTDTATPSSPYGGLDGRIVFTRNPNGHEESSHEIYVLDLDSGGLRRLTNNQVADWDPHWSPDGRLIAFVSYQAGNYDIWVMNSDGSGQTNRIALPAWDDYPAWSPDGTQLAFVSTGMTDGKANSEVFVGSTTENVRQLSHNTGRDEWPSWAPSGQRVAASSDEDGDMDIYLYRVDGAKVNHWTNDPGYDEQPAWSPNGKWIAFIRKTTDTNGNGRLDRRDDGEYGCLWVGRPDGSEFKQLTFDNRAADPAWSPDGKHIVFAHFKDSNGDGLVGLDDASDLWVIPAGGGDPIVLLAGPEQDWAPDWTE